MGQTNSSPQGFTSQDCSLPPPVHSSEGSHSERGMAGFSLCLASKDSFVTSATHDSLLKTMLKQAPTYKCIQCAYCSGHPASPESSSSAHKLCSECDLDTSSSWWWWGGPKICSGKADDKLPFFCFSLRNWTDQQEKKAHELFEDGSKQSKFYKKRKRYPCLGVWKWVFLSINPISIVS